MGDRTQEIAELIDKYNAVMQELEQLSAHPSAFPCDRLISELSEKAAHLRVQLQAPITFRTDGILDENIEKPKSRRLRDRAD